MSENTPDISVVVPVYNERPNLDRLYAELTAALEAYGRSYEVVAVDDGSRDGSFEALHGFQEQDPRWRVVRLLRNFGQSPALYAGFSKARGRVVLTIDADLQVPPAEISKVVDALEAGRYDEVHGVRMNRRDSWFRRVASRGINAVMSRVLGTKVSDLGSGLKAYRSEVIEYLNRSTHHSRYVPAETAWLGTHVGTVPIAHQDRAAGESKYGLLSLLRVHFDMIASVSTAPVHLVGMVGWVFALLGFAMGLRIGYVRLVHGDFNQLTSVVAIFFVLAGVQMIATSVLCEYVSRIYKEVQARPYYIIDRVYEDGSE
jgi:undecaprenyl-phosphate 4-deoxy-4-formamido-L-arabinose transferase